MNIFEKLDAIQLPTWRKLAGDVTDKEYRNIVAYDNCTSYSQLLELHTCPRMYQLNKAAAKQPSIEGEQTNVHFAFGHSVGAGVATYMATKNLTAGLFASFVAWRADYNLTNGKGKSLADAQFAIELFAASGIADDWEVYMLSSGQPAVELAFSVDCENGYKHYGHIDLVGKHKQTGKVAVWEFKTTGYGIVDEALYANSSQALSYSVVLDSIAPGSTTFEVNYAVYSSTKREWQALPFTKSILLKASWLQDLLLDHGTIDTYRGLNFFPKRGESCANQFGQRCRYFGICDLTGHAEDYKDLPDDRQAENVNFSFRLSELLDQQRANNETE